MSDASTLTDRQTDRVWVSAAAVTDVNVKLQIQIQTQELTLKHIKMNCLIQTISIKSSRKKSSWCTTMLCNAFLMTAQALTDVSVIREHLIE